MNIGQCLRPLGLLKLSIVRSELDLEQHVLLTFCFGAAPSDANKVREVQAVQPSEARVDFELKIRTDLARTNTNRPLCSPRSLNEPCIF